MANDRIKNLFNVENRFMHVVMTVGNLVMLNILFILTSLPVVTIGASLSASYAVVWKMVCDKDNMHIFPTYFKAFKREFKQATYLMLIVLGAGAVLVCDLYFSIILLDSVAGLLFLCFSGLLTLVFLLGLTFLFPIQAHFTNKTFIHIRNAYMLGLRRFFTTLFLLLLRVALVVTIVFYHFVMPALTFVLIMGGFGFIFYIDVLCVKRTAERYGIETIYDSGTSPKEYKVEH